MNVHKNARLTPFGRERIVRQIASGQTPEAAGKAAGVSLLITESLKLLDPYWEQLDLVTIVGTAMGIKGASMDSSVPEKIRRARQIISDRGLNLEIQVDGGIRREKSLLADKTLRRPAGMDC